MVQQTTLINHDNKDSEKDSVLHSYIGSFCKFLSQHVCNNSRLKQVDRLLTHILKTRFAYSKQESLSIRSCQYEASQVPQTKACVFNIRCLGKFYNASVETFVTAIDIIHHFCATVKVPTKYLSCMTAACFLLASKLHEDVDSECSPTVTELARLHRHAWTTSDLKRMEITIMKKLNWNISRITPLNFLMLFCDLATCVLSEEQTEQWSASLSLHNLTAKVEVLACSFSAHQFKASTVALCILDSVLTEAHLHRHVVLRETLFLLQTLCQVSDAEFYECSMSLLQVLHAYNAQVDHWSLSTVKQSSSHCNRNPESLKAAYQKNKPPMRYTKSKYDRFSGLPTIPEEDGWECK